MLWLRGIIPPKLTQIPSSSDNLQRDFIFVYDLAAPDIGSWPSGDYYGDVARGRDAAYPTTDGVALVTPCR